jgi:hypothetical protein
MVSVATFSANTDVHDLLIINLLEVSVIFIVYICLVFGENPIIKRGRDPIIKRGRDPIIMRGRDPINRFNLTHRIEIYKVT